MGGDARPQVFLSYSRADFYRAEQAKRLLEQQGLEVWMDLAELGPGDDWWARIRAAIHSAECVPLLAPR